jgi:hypothetical protein
MPRVRQTSLFLIALLGLHAGSATAQEGAFALVLRCKNDDARVELYLPETIVRGRGDPNARLARPVKGYYALDLTEAGKGKPLEPVRVSLTADRKGLVVDQYTRKLPPTTVPVAGGKVSFDKRFAEDMVCGPFNE